MHDSKIYCTYIFVSIDVWLCVEVRTCWDLFVQMFYFDLIWTCVEVLIWVDMALCWMFGFVKMCWFCMEIFVRVDLVLCVYMLTCGDWFMFRYLEVRILISVNVSWMCICNADNSCSHCRKSCLNEAVSLPNECRAVLWNRYRIPSILVYICQNSCYCYNWILGKNKLRRECVNIYTRECCFMVIEYYFFFPVFSRKRRCCAIWISFKCYGVGILEE